MDPEFDTSQLFVQHVINTPIYNHPNLSVILSDKYEVIPEFRIPHSGVLTRWLFAARLSLTLSRDNPQLHVWRRLPNKALDAYFLVHSANLQLDRGSSLGTYEYTLEIPAPVKAGDILGFYQPPWDVLQFNLAVLNNEGPLVHELTLGHFDPFFVAINSSKTSYRALPLMSAELLPGELRPWPPSWVSVYTPCTLEVWGECCRSYNNYIIAQSIVHNICSCR